MLTSTTNPSLHHDTIPAVEAPGDEFPHIDDGGDEELAFGAVECFPIRMPGFHARGVVLVALTLLSQDASIIRAQDRAQDATEQAPQAEDVVTPAEAEADAVHAYIVDPCSEAAAMNGTNAPSRSYGTTGMGHLSGAVFLSDSPTRYHVDDGECAFWGLSALVGLVERAAASVEARWPGARLAVGELSLQEGGRIRGHASHTSGRDVDFGFYFLDRRGNIVEPGRLIDVRSNGTARLKSKWVRFDVQRNWHLVNALLDDPETDVEIILVNARIRMMLINEARRQRVPRSRLNEAARVLVVPERRGHPHLNHFHVRIFCPEDSPECENGRPLWDWTVARRALRAIAHETADELTAPPPRE